MKKLFNKANAAVSPYTDPSPPPGPSLPSQSREAVYQHPPQHNRHRGEARGSQSGIQTSLPRSTGAGRADYSSTGRSNGSGPNSTRRPGSAGAVAAGTYPSYGESHRTPYDSNGRNGDSQGNDGLLIHHKLPPRSDVGSHFRAPSTSYSQSSDQSSHYYTEVNKERRSTQREAPLSNPHVSSNNNNSSSRERDQQSNTSSLERRGSKVRDATMSRMRSVSKRMGPSQDEERRTSKALGRRPSLAYGTDSGLHGGQAGIALAEASANEQQGSLTGRPVMRPDSQYVDRYEDPRAQQVAALNAGVDKVKRKLFSRKHRDGREEELEAGVKSSDEWLRVDAPTPGLATSPQPHYQALPHNRSGLSVERGPEKSHSSDSRHGPWYAGLKQQSKSSETNVTFQFGALCITDEEDWDWQKVNDFCNAISHSEAASKEAARALRKEFKYGDEKPKASAVRLWALLCVRSSDRFRLQVANKKFLEVLEDLYTDSKTSTRIRGRMLLAWSMLAHEYQSDHDLHPITKAFNKIKPVDMPTNGVPLDLSHELFTPPSSGPHDVEVTRNEAAVSNQQSHHPLSAPVSYPPGTVSGVGNPSSRQHEVLHPQDNPHQGSLNYHPPVRVPASAETVDPHHREQMRRLHEACQAAKADAHLLTESLIGNGLDSDLVVEFAERAQHSQEFILAQIPWASAQVDRVRAQRDTIGPNAQQGEGERQAGAEEDRLMEDLLATHERLSAALSMVEQARNRAREEEEERQAIDRSIVEQRIDRSTMMQDEETGQLYNYGSQSLTLPGNTNASASGSRSPSPLPPVVRRPLPIPSSTSSSTLQPPASASMQQSLSMSSQGSLGRNTPTTLPQPPSLTHRHDPRNVPGPLQGTHYSSAYAAMPAPPALPPKGAGVHGNNEKQGHLRGASDDDDDDDDDDSDDHVATPIAPSAKALGKRRAMSTTYDAVPGQDEDKQASDLADQVAEVTIQPDTNHVDTLRARPPPALPPLPVESPAVSPAATTSPTNQSNPFRKAGHPLPNPSQYQTKSQQQQHYLSNNTIKNPFRA